MMKRCFICLIYFLFLCPAVWAGDVYVLSLNDLHGWVEEQGGSPGMARINAFIKHFRVQHPDTLAVLAGDNYQGGALSNLSRGAVLNAAFAEAGIHVSAAGNHDFDWTPKFFPLWREQDMQFLAANVVDLKTGQNPDGIKPYMILSAGGKKIAFIGLSTRDTPFITDKECTEGLRFLEEVQSAQRWIDFLQQGKDSKGRPDAIILLTHIASYQENPHHITGSELKELTKISGVNAVITAHSHQLVCGRLNGIPVIQSDCHGKAIGVLRIRFENDVLNAIEPKVIVFKDVNPKPEPDPATVAIIEKYKKQYARIIERKICRAKDTMQYSHRGSSGETALGYAICDAMRHTTSAHIAMVNNGGIRASLEAGDVTYGDVTAILPFDNYVVTGKMQGRDIKSMVMMPARGRKAFNSSGPHFQYAGLRLIYEHSDAGDKLQSITLEDGRPIQDDALYIISVMDFMYKGGDGFGFQNMRDVKYSNKFVRDIVCERWSELKELRVPDLTNAIRYVKRRDVVKQPATRQPAAP